MDQLQTGLYDLQTKYCLFSAVCDIGSAAFKYDMRRLSEILTFPKAWYRRNLARRLFLGDESWVMEDGGRHFLLLLLSYFLFNVV